MGQGIRGSRRCGLPPRTTATSTGLIAGRQALAEPCRPPAGCDRDLRLVGPGRRAQAVYMKGVAKQLTGAELEQGLEVFDRLSRQDIGRAFGLDDVQGCALFRLYRATVSEHWVCPGSGSRPGLGVDAASAVARLGRGGARSRLHRLPLGGLLACLGVHRPRVQGQGRPPGQATARTHQGRDRRLFVMKRGCVLGARLSLGSTPSRVRAATQSQRSSPAPPSWAAPKG